MTQAIRDMVRMRNRNIIFDNIDINAKYISFVSHFDNWTLFSFIYTFEYKSSNVLIHIKFMSYYIF